MSSVRILLITDDFRPALGGIASYLYDLYRHIPPDEVVIVAPAEATSATWDARNDLRVTRYRFSRWLPVRWLSALITATATLRRVRPHVIHCGTLLSSGLIGWMLSILFHRPYAIHVYGTDLTTTQRSYVMQRLVVALLRRASRVIVISDFGMRCAMQLGVGPARITRIVPPVDAQFFTPAPADHQVRSDTKYVLLTVGRLVRRKGHDVVLRALAILLPRYPDLQYVIAGDGPERERLTRMASDLGVMHAVRLTGNVSNLLDVYRSCDVFVMMSRDSGDGDVEGFGIAFSEASACGKPVIGTFHGGVPEAVVNGVTGLLVPAEDEAALAAAIVSLLDDPAKRHRLGNQGREHVVTALLPSAGAERLREVAATMAIER